MTPTEPNEDNGNPIVFIQPPRVLTALSIIAAHSSVGHGYIPFDPPCTEKVPELSVDEKRFGRASPEERSMTLAGRKGKTSRKKRKAAKAKRQACSQSNEITDWDNTPT